MYRKYKSCKIQAMKDNTITHILVPLDFSETSFNALETAIAVAKQHNTTITLLNVVDANALFEFKGFYYIAEKSINSIVEDSARKLSTLAKKVKGEHALNCNPEVTVGPVALSIIKTAFDIDADLIIMGTQGVSGFRKFFIGSSAQKVIKLASCPVLTIPSNGKWIEFKKILFLIRPVAAAIEKYDWVRKIITDDSAAINLLVLAHTYEGKEKKLLQNFVKELKAKAIKDKIKVSGTLKVGEKMPQAALKMSKYVGPDVIVLTSSADCDLKQFFIGPFEQHIVNHANVPVLSIKPKLVYPISSVGIQQVHELLPTQTPILA
jgi:nucleotide-binding universal stress UspA family protein